MNHLFRTVPLKTRSLFQKIFRQYPQENAVIELNNLLAGTPVRSIQVNDIREIEQRHGVSLYGEFRLNLEEFYAVFFNDCLKNYILSQEDREKLLHLKHILLLDDKTVNELQLKIGQQVYRRALKESIVDNRLTEEKRRFLKTLEQDLQLATHLASAIYGQETKTIVTNYVNQVLNSGVFSPAKEEKLHKICSSLGVNLTLTTETRNKLEKLKLLWAAEHLPLPSVRTDIALQRNEVCHLCIHGVAWLETRSIRISGGSSTQVMQQIDSGTLYLTDKRIVLNGRFKTYSIRLEKILRITPFKDGVSIEKDAGKNPRLKMPQQADVFCIMLRRLLNG